jgi:hypothetical protein
MDYIIMCAGTIVIVKYCQQSLANYMIHHPFITTRFQAILDSSPNWNEFKE